MNRLIIALVLLIGGSLLAALVQTSVGEVRLHDVRFVNGAGDQMSGLLYMPRGVNAQNPAPGVLAIHGYINSRETQSGFAIELARRGFVVLALDQTGHGYSDPPAFAEGFGGPAGLAFLRSLPFVDTDRIGLEGHSMGGWASLMAAVSHPDGYRSMVLAGSSTGTLGTPEGTVVFPRNVLLIFSLYDEFSALMWGAENPANIVNTQKLQTLFGTNEMVQKSRLYGDMESGTARMLTQPAVTHPGDHLSRRAIGDAVAWFQRTLDAGTQIPAGEQVWYWKELGTLMALVGLVVLIFPLVDWILGWRVFRPLSANPLGHVSNTPVTMSLTAVMMAVIPIITFFPLQMVANLIVPANPVLPQQITNGVLLWALGNGVIITVLFVFWQKRNRIDRIQLGVPDDANIIFGSLLAAAICCGSLYLVLALADFFFTVDFRFWVVALKLMSPVQFQMFLVYLIPFTLFFFVLSLALHNQLRWPSTSARTHLAANAAVLSAGFIVMLIVQYATLFMSGSLLIAEPLLTIVAFQFVPLMMIVALISTWCFLRTEQVYLGTFINGILVTWYIVAGQATQAVPF
ncbi:MAG: alpha/beta fold hydrolase [Pseudomonadales bacterium]|nr:alpha/beta fold hydrolase [Pseudomonadales bacterium]